LNSWQRDTPEIRDAVLQSDPLRKKQPEGRVIDGSISVPSVQIGILTIRDDEFKAVLKAFPDDPAIHRGRHREYSIRSADAGNGHRYRIAILRQVEQGNGEAQEAARDLIDDLRPALLLVVGIAGGLPSEDITLGDVVVSTRIVDFSVEARKFEDNTSYSIGGGPIAKSIVTGIANLSAREDEFGEWTADLPPRPKVVLTAGNFYGPRPWKKTVKDSLQRHFGDGVPERPPVFAAGPIASSDRLVKDPVLLVPVLTTSRHLLAIEMESAGVHRAARDNTPMLAVRGLSDIVGFKRSDLWTKYACAAAANFVRGYLRTTPVPIATNEDHAALNVSVGAADRAVDEEEAFANLLPLRHFPERLYVGPALCRSMKHGWSILRRPGAPQHISGAWTLYEGNVYSFEDPERSSLRSIVDVGGLEEFAAKEWAFADDNDKRRLFVYLLNACLKDDLWTLGVRHHSDQDVYAFMGWPDEPPRRLKYANLKVRSTATVVAHYESTSKQGKKYKYLRHTAFQGRFRLLDGQYYLEITPTYRFTRDGRDLDRFHEDRLSGIKRLERNRSVLSQLLIWQATMRAPWPRSDAPRLLEFAPLLSFKFSSNVDESELTALDPPSVPVSTDKEIEE
jgi:nucleoside phosphorylase